MDAVLDQVVLQRAAGHGQKPGRLAQIAPGKGERVADVVADDRLQRPRLLRGASLHFTGVADDRCFDLVGVDLLSPRYRVCPQEQLTQLPHVAGKRQRTKQVASGRGQAAGKPVAPGQLGEEMIRQSIDVGRALAQWRDLEDEPGEPMEQVQAEALPGGEVGERAIAGGDEAYVDPYGSIHADRLYLALLDGSQQRRLELRGRFRHLVEHEGGALGSANPADAVAGSPGERAAPVPEQLGGQQIRADAGAVDHLQGTVGPTAARVDDPGDPFFAHSGLADQQHGLVEGRDALDLCAQPGAGLAASDQVVRQAHRGRVSGAVRRPGRRAAPGMLTALQRTAAAFLLTTASRSYEDLPTSGDARTGMSDGSVTYEPSAVSIERAWRTFRRRWRGYAISLTSNETDAEEIVQEAVTRTLRARPSLRDETEAHRYVVTAIRTAALRLFEQRRRAPTRDTSHLPEPGDVASDPLRMVLSDEATERRSRLAQAALGALQELRPEYRQAIELVILREPPLKLRELAELQGASISTVHSRLQAALRQLGRALVEAAEVER